MLLKYITSEFADELSNNFETYRSYYQLSQKDELQNLFEENSFNSSIEVELPELDFSDDVGYSDTVNAQRLHQALKTLTPREASDERLWIHLFHTTYYDFLRYRVSKTNGYDLETGKFGSSAVLFTGNNKDRRGRAKNINYLSRLWWAGYFTCENGNYNLLPLVTENDFSNNMTLLFGGSRQFSNNLTLIHGYLKAIKHFFETNSHPKRNRIYYEEGMQYLSLRSSSVMLDMFSEEEIEAMVYNRLVSTFS